MYFRHYCWPTQKTFSLLKQNSGYDQIFTFLLVASYFQGAGSGSQVQPEEKNHDGDGPIIVIQTLSRDWFGHCHVMPSGATTGKIC